MPLFVSDGKGPVSAAGPSRRMVWAGAALGAPVLIPHGHLAAAAPLGTAYIALKAGRITAVSVRGTSTPVVDVVVNASPVATGLGVGLAPLAPPLAVAAGDVIEVSLASAAGAADVVVELLIES